ncbi:MAG: hypothetical protein KIS79_01825 [Burkholderiales bacterium]|nr:hypothetical protein [Burkholderiales bacterium]
MGEQLSELAALEHVLQGMQRIAVAVSGGVDSLSLAAYAHRLLPGQVVMYHAVSAAVPGEGTRRTRDLAAQEGWILHVIDAGEFEDSNYRANPVNRCFYCKTSLYGAIRAHTRTQIVSGTNVDDLGEYRPGLIAAKEHGVRHPFVEAGMGKGKVRALARELGLGEVAELPSSPCLSSRVETGIAIDPRVLAGIHDVEQQLIGLLAPRTVRCRVRVEAIVIELDAATLDALDHEKKRSLTARVQQRFAGTHPDAAVRFERYQVGSAFLHFKPPLR